MKTKIIKNVVQDGVPTIIYLVFNDTEYVATIEFNCFTLTCEILDSDHKLEDNEFYMVNCAILQSIQECFKLHNPTSPTPPPPYFYLKEE